MTSQLPPLRAQIRGLDDDILKLIAERLRVAAEIGRVKNAEGLPIKDFQVERDVQAHARRRAAELGVFEDLAGELADLLIRYAVKTQETSRVATAPEAGARQILIVGGLGLMGRWLAGFFASSGHAVTLSDVAGEAPADVAYPYVASTPDMAHFAAAAAVADVIVLATPIGATAAVLRRLVALNVKGLVFDICSLKSPITTALTEAARALRVTSLHPMFGPAVTTLAGRRIVICEVEGPHARAAAEAARTLFAETSAEIVATSLSEHDRRMGLVLGLSHLTNLIFGTALAQSGVDYAALDATASSTFKAQLGVAVPVARENQDLYFAIQAQNATTPDVLKLFKATADRYARAIEQGDAAEFKQLMGAAERYFAKAPGGRP